MGIRRFVLAAMTAAASVCPAFGAAFEGVVYDKQTGEPLIGAMVYVKERPDKGTVTDLDGHFTMEDIVEKEVVVVSYIGYDRIEVVCRQAHGEVEIGLMPSAVELSDIEVVSNANINTEAGARMTEQKSKVAVNVISAKSIEISPDLNVANVLRRMSGVTIEKNSGEGEYAVLRGMDKRYNYTLVNGIKIPSPDNKDRYVPMDMFPSDMLDRLEVSKTLTPDMEGDATGGVINLVMKDAPPSLTVNANIGGGFGTMALANGFTTYDVKNITKLSPREQYGTDYSASIADFSAASSNIRHMNGTLPDGVIGFSVGNRLYRNRLGIILAGNFQHHINVKKNLMFDDNMTMDGKNALTVTKMKDRLYSEQLMQYGGHLKVDYRFNNRHQIEWYNAIVGTDNTQVRESDETDLSLSYKPDEGTELHYLETRSRVTRQMIFNSTLQGEHDFGAGFGAEWSVAYSIATYNRPDNTYVTLEDAMREYVHYVTADYSERRWEHNTDQNVNAKVDFDYGHEWGAMKLTVKAGGLFRTTARKNSYVSYNLMPAGATRPVQGVDFNSLTEIAWRVNTPKGSVGPLMYDAGEDIGAAYLMGTFELPRWRFIAGVRAEHTDQNYFMYFPKAGDDPNGGQRYWDFLPSVHVKYSPIESMNIRASYFRSVNRPGFFEIVPFSMIYEDYTEYGNKDLRRAVIDNVDLRWEWYPTKMDQLMVGLFYKHIEDPIEYAYRTVNNRQFGYGPANLGNARNMGVEIDIIKYIRWFGIKANYTYTYSRITTPKTVYLRDENNRLSRAEWNQTRPLVGQSPHVANLTLMVNLPEYGWDIQLSGSYNSEKIAIASHYYESDYWDGGYFQLDASIEKGFKCGVSIFAKGSNLLNTVFRRYVKTQNDSNFDKPHQSADSGYTLIEEERPGATLLFGIRYKL